MYLRIVCLLEAHDAYVQLTVEVVDSNEYSPELEQSVYSVSVPESAVAGTRLVHLSASDKDSTSQLVYSLHSARSAASLQLFNLDHVTGLLSVTQPLDR